MNGRFFIYISAALISMQLFPISATGGCVEGDCTDGKGTYFFADGEMLAGLFQNGKFIRDAAAK